MVLLKKLKFHFDSLLFHEFSNFCISFISHFKTIFVAVKCKSKQKQFFRSLIELNSEYE